MKRLMYLVLLMLAVTLSSANVVYAQGTEVTLDITKCPGGQQVGGDVWITPAGDNEPEMYVGSGNSVYLYDMTVKPPRLVTMHTFPDAVSQVRRVRHAQKTRIVYVTTTNSLYRFYLGGAMETEWVSYGTFHNLSQDFVIESIDYHDAMIVALGQDIYIEAYTSELASKLPESVMLRGRLDITFPIQGSVSRGWDDIATNVDQDLYAVSRLEGIWKYDLSRNTDGDVPVYSVGLSEQIDLHDEVAWEIRGYPEDYMIALDGGYNRHSNGGLILNRNDGGLRNIPNGADAMLSARGAVVSTYLDGIVFVDFLGNHENELHRVRLPDDSKTWKMARWNRDTFYVKTYEYGVLGLRDMDRETPIQLCPGSELRYRVFLPVTIRMNEEWMGELNTPRPGEWATPTPRYGPTARTTPYLP